MPVKIFFCYAREDELLLNKLKPHLQLMQRQGIIDTWHDREINAGVEWEQEISKQLNEAQIILLLISPDFMTSHYAYSVEMQRAMMRHERGEARVIPIILRAVNWNDAPFSRLQALPVDAKPVKSWSNQDDAFFSISEGVRKAVKDQLLKYSYTCSETSRYGEALSVMKQVIQLDPNNASHYKSLGDLLTQLDRNMEAVKAFERAVELEPNYPIAYNNMAWALLRLNRYNDALKACDKALEFDPNYASAYRNKGRALYELKLPLEALDAYNQAILLDPNNESVYENKGWVLYSLKRYQEALIAYQQAIKLNSENATLHIMKGNVLRELKLFNDALDAFEQALRLDPHLVEIHEKKEATLQDIQLANANREAKQHGFEIQNNLFQAHQIHNNLLLVEMKVESVRINLETSQRVIILKAKEQEVYYFLWIAHAEAYVLAIKLQGTVSPRPLSHDLFKEILDGLGITITMAILTEMIDDITYAYLRLKIADKEMDFDARPSDAIILAQMSGAPIFMEKQLLQTVGVELDEEEESKG
jgi:tetratricopeptide (TPR) repeat protein